MGVILKIKSIPVVNHNVIKLANIKVLNTSPNYPNTSYSV